MSNKVIQSWDWDIRVRERNLKQGKLTDKDVEKFITTLPDLAEVSESVSMSQPAIAGRED